MKERKLGRIEAEHTGGRGGVIGYGGGGGRLLLQGL